MAWLRGEVDGCASLRRHARHVGHLLVSAVRTIPPCRCGGLSESGSGAEGRKKRKALINWWNARDPWKALRLHSMQNSRHCMCVPPARSPKNHKAWARCPAWHRPPRISTMMWLILGVFGIRSICRTLRTKDRMEAVEDQARQVYIVLNILLLYHVFLANTRIVTQSPTRKLSINSHC